jgi:hypothetical protein
VPFKANTARRHHIPKQRHRVTNWAEYDDSLRQRGSLTVWFTDAAIAAWRAMPRTTPGGQPHYSALAILTALTLRAGFRLALRQTEGLIGSILRLLGLDLAVPDHSTIGRRASTLQVPRPRLGTEPVHLLVDSTGLKLGGPGEWGSRSMARGSVVPGASCISVWTPPPAGSVTLAEILADSGHYSIDSTTVRAHVSAAGGKGGLIDALGRLRGGFTSELHCLADARGRLRRIAKPMTR